MEQAESASPQQSTERVVVLEPNDGARRVLLTALQDKLPNVELLGTATSQELLTHLERAGVDVVVLNRDLGDANSLELLHELRLHESEPRVLIVAQNHSSQDVAQCYTAGCDRYLVQEARWLEELSPAVRHLLRLRRLEDENRRLLARLTEANGLLEEKNRRLDEFAATLAHDIRGPLGGISMKLEYILEEHQANLNERCRDLMVRTLRSAGRLTSTVQMMYEYAKIGAQAARMAEVSLSPLIEEIVHDLDVAQAKDVEIQIEELPVVWGNADLLRRLFINLIGNAIKYSDKPLTKIRIVSLGAVIRTIARFSRIAVIDNGPGISEKDQKQIFSMFARGPQVRGIEGIGLGLAITQRIAELHYGSVELESKLGSGSTFSVTLPTERIDFSRPT